MRPESQETEPLDDEPALPSEESLGVVDPARYAIQEEIGRGGQGRVLLAQDLRLRRPVAIKEMLHTSAESVARFVREAMITAHLEHPGIVPVHEAGRWTTGELFYTMKRVTGRPLDEIIADTPSLEQRLLLLPNAIAATDAIAYAHTKGFVHRDVKPANILVGAFGETLVVDWGVAKWHADASAAADPVESNDTPNAHTRLGAVVGTPAYMAPEQARGESVDGRADVYALGATLYHLLAGEPPFAAAPSSGGSNYAVLAGPPRPLAEIAPGIPRELSTIVEKAMARDPAERYAGAKELAEDLKRFGAGQLVAAHRYSTSALLRRWLRRYRLAVGLSLAFVAALATFATLAIRRVVVERNVARAERRAAEQATDETRIANDNLRLQTARAELDRDPTASIAWLKTYPANAPGWAEVGAIAQDAWSRGVARHVWRGEPPFVSVAVTGDGARVAAASGAKKLYVWNERSGEERVVDVDEVGGALAFSPDGRRLATSDVIDGVRVFDTATWTSVRMGGERTGSGRLEFTPDGKLLVGRSTARLRAHVWEVEGGVERRFGADDVIAASPSGDGAMVVVRPGAVTFHEIATGKETDREPIDGVPQDLRASADGRIVVVGTREHALVVLDRVHGTRRKLTASETDLRSLHLAPNGLFAASCGLDSSLWLWDLAAGGRALARGSASCGVMSFSPDGASLLGADIANHLQVWDTESGVAHVLHGHAATIAGGTLSKDGRSVVSASADGARLFRLGEGDVRLLHGRTVVSPPSKDGALALTIGHDQALSLWSITTSALTPISGPRPNVWGLSGSMSADGARIVFPEDSQRIMLWEAGIGARVLDRLRDTRHVADAISPDGTKLATTREDGSVWLYDVATAQARMLGRHGSTAITVRFSPDGQRVASGGRDRLIKLWDLAGGAGRDLRGHSATVWSLGFSPDGTRLVSGGADGLVMDWALVTGEGRPLRGHLATVYSVDLSPDGKRVLSASSDGTVRLWELSSGASCVLRRDAAAVTFVHFLPGGTRALSSGDAGTTWVWDIAATPGLDHDASRLAAWMKSITTAEVDAPRGVVATRH